MGSADVIRRAADIPFESHAPTAKHSAPRQSRTKTSDNYPSNVTYALTTVARAIHKPNQFGHFASRIQSGLNYALEKDGTPLIACHGGVFRAVNYMYDNMKNFTPIKNCVLYSFTPDETVKIRAPL